MNYQHPRLHCVLRMIERASVRQVAAALLIAFPLHLSAQSRDPTQKETWSGDFVLTIKGSGDKQYPVKGLPEATRA